MAINYFDVGRGLSIDENVQIIATSGAPVGTEADAAVKGTVALDFLNGRMYQKGDTGSGPELWQLVGADTNWRGESEVRDNVAVVLPTFTPATNGTVDGETIDDQERVLFSNAALGNIYIYDKSAGAFVEDTNEETAGDTTFIVRGTDAGKKYTYSGSAWVQTDQASIDEFGFVHTFIGKTAFGSETPTYTSQVNITNGDNLEVAAGKLDAAIAAIVGLVTNTLTGVSGTNVADAANVDTNAAVKWLVTVRQGAAVAASEIFAVHDGIDAGADAAATDFTRYAKIKLGGVIAGLAFDVTLTGVGGAQVMNLEVTTTGAADIHVTRVPVNF